MKRPTKLERAHVWPALIGGVFGLAGVHAFDRGGWPLAGCVAMLAVLLMLAWARS